LSRPPGRIPSAKRTDPSCGNFGLLVRIGYMQFTRRIVVAAGFLCLLTPIHAQTVESPRKTFLEVQQPIQDKNVNGLLNLIDQNAVLYLHNTIYPIDRADYADEEFRRIFEAWFARIYSAGFTHINVDYRVFGTTGLIWGEGRFAQDVRGGSGSDQDRRLSVIFVWEGDSWKIALWSGSPPPMGR